MKSVLPICSDHLMCKPCLINDTLKTLWCYALRKKKKNKPSNPSCILEGQHKFSLIQIYNILWRCCFSASLPPGSPTGLVLLHTDNHFGAINSETWAHIMTGVSVTHTKCMQTHITHAQLSQHAQEGGGNKKKQKTACTCAPASAQWSTHTHTHSK